MSKNNHLIIASFRHVSVILVLCLLFPINGKAVEPSLQQRQNGDSQTVAPHAAPEEKQLKRVSENGGEVLIDGSLRVFEPIYAKISDYVEISTSVKPISNHVRMYAVAVGTYTVIRVQFDDGQDKVLINN